MLTQECNSIYDLAEIAGVSYATVSRVLNGRAKTSEASRKAVLTAAAKYNFKPRMKARRITIGLLFDMDRAIEHTGYVDQWLIRLINKLSQHNLMVEIFTSHNFQQLNESMVDGVIALLWGDECLEYLKKLKNIPKIVINDLLVENCSTVYSDHAQSGTLAAEYLLSKGHTKCGIILNCQNWGNQERARGFKEQFIKQIGSFDSRLLEFDGSHLKSDKIKKMLNLGMTAVFLGVEDDIIHYLEVIKSQEIEIPKDLSIVTMENPLISNFLNFTTVASPFDSLINKAVELLVKQIKSKNFKNEKICFPNKIIIRGN